MIKAVIFDLDDTLISEKDYIKSGYRAVAKSVSEALGEQEEKLYQSLIDLFNESPKNVFNRLYDMHGITYTKQAIMELVELYRNHKPDVRFFDDVMPCLLGLKEKGLKLGIITDGYSNAQQQKLEAVQAFELFDELVITDKIGREYWKPHPRAFEMLKEHFQVGFDEMVYIGDNPEKDFYIAHTYPITTIRIQRDGVYKDRSYLEDVKEHYTIQSLDELDGVLAEINRR